jgi:general stress protein 26
MRETPFNYDNVSGYTLEADAERQLVESQNECTFMWSTKDGWPVGVIMSYVFHEGCFWLSVSSLRVRVQAVERDARTSIAITAKGVDVPQGRSLTYKGTTEVLRDRATIQWFLPALAKRLRPGDEAAQALFVKLNDTPNRRVLRFTPQKTIGYDGQKMRKATADAVAAGRTIGPTDSS